MILRKYGVATTVPIKLFEADGVNFRVDAVYASGDVKITKDESAETTTAVIRAADDSKTRITATVDSDGNRSSVTTDATG